MALHFRQKLLLVHRGSTRKRLTSGLMAVLAFLTNFKAVEGLLPS